MLPITLVLWVDFIWYYNSLRSLNFTSWCVMFWQDYHATLKNADCSKSGSREYWIIFLWHNLFSCAWKSMHAHFVSQNIIFLCLKIMIMFYAQIQKNKLRADGKSLNSWAEYFPDPIYFTYFPEVVWTN